MASMRDRVRPGLRSRRKATLFEGRGQASAKRSFVRRPSATELCSVAGRTACHGWQDRGQSNPEASCQGWHEPFIRIPRDVFTASAMLPHPASGGSKPICFAGDHTNGGRKRPSQPVSRVLSRTIIHLRPASPQACSSLPESGASHTVGFLFGLAPGGVYLAADCCQPRGALLPHHFTLTGPESGGMLSVALSVGSRPPGVTWRPALWSPDFPPSAPSGTDSDCPADSGCQPNSVSAG